MGKRLRINKWNLGARTTSKYSATCRNIKDCLTNTKKNPVNKRERKTAALSDINNVATKGILIVTL